MNKDQLASVVAAEVGLSQSDAKKAVEAVFDGVTNGMKNGDKVSIAGFGTFESRYRAARQGRNPATGETIQIAAKNAPAFKAAKGLKDDESRLFFLWRKNTYIPRNLYFFIKKKIFWFFFSFNN